ncbi:MAG: RNA polymerase sigma factor [Caldilineaceae bacterium]|nr:RNA polymerase sigma factor [Caldilineaceae bacterium]MBP8106844.1 RNA polymerase sigma factor [Caldilineaceae bacterium]MBP8121738.1 RNA polymerase sigma factor [Caldilineaceae bacterium]MBP9071472.1 RNA polymerase sigma factor [Caldilineaceae bacterium]
MPSSTDQERFLAQIEEYKRILYKVANAYGTNQDDRQDLVQDMVVQLWRSFDRFDGRAKFSTWMYRVAMNVAISAARSQTRRIQDALPLDEAGLEIPVEEPWLADEGDDLRLLHQMIGRLDELNRALIILYLDGYSHAEIGEIMGLSATNVSTRINRIKQRWQNDFDTAQTGQN